MRFFDCNAHFGLPFRRPLMPVPNAATLLAEMDRAGVERALVWHIAQHDASAQAGNDLLAQAIAPHQRLVGCWTILPNQAAEFPPPRVFFQQMRQQRIGALRVFPNPHHFLANAVSMGDWFEAMTAHRIPLLVSVRAWEGDKGQPAMDWPQLYGLLADFPKLVCVVCDHGCWGEDRRFRPLLERYPNVYVDIGHYLLDGGLEGLVADYGAGRVLFGSSFPLAYFGGMMMALKHARIPAEAKEAIAHGNLERILAEVAA